jgi:hypothetical protein
MPLPSISASVPGVRVVSRHDGVEREDAGTPGANPRGVVRSDPSKEWLRFRRACDRILAV